MTSLFLHSAYPLDQSAPSASFKLSIAAVYLLTIPSLGDLHLSNLPSWLLVQPYSLSGYSMYARKKGRSPINFLARSRQA